MEKAGVPFDLVALWYKEYTGGYENDNNQQGTTVPAKRGTSSGLSGGPSWRVNYKQ
jgi:hypothetical protein